MKQSELIHIVSTILKEHFAVTLEPTEWKVPLQTLHEDFKILGNLIDLETRLQPYFEQKILLVENIATSIHTPEDIIQLLETL